jgi:hypothetical protein
MDGARRQFPDEPAKVAVVRCEKPRASARRNCSAMIVAVSSGLLCCLRRLGHVNAVFGASISGQIPEGRRRARFRWDMRPGKRSVRNWKNLYRGFLLQKQYAGKMAPDYLTISELPVKKVICASGPRMYQLLLAPRARSWPPNYLPAQAGSGATQIASSEKAQSRHAPATHTALSRPAISRKLVLK